VKTKTIWFPAAFSGILIHIAITSLVIDAKGMEGYIQSVRDSWIDASFTVPLAIILLASAYRILSRLNEAEKKFWNIASNPKPEYRYDSAPMETAFDKAINTVCAHTPHDFVLHVCVENGAAWVEVWMDGEYVKLPDSADKAISEQLNDVICIINGFDMK